MAENLGNDWSSTLNGAINDVVTSLDVTSASGVPTQGSFRIRIDDELMLVTAVATNTFTVTRGVEGTAAASHSNGAAVAHVVTLTGMVKYLGVGEWEVVEEALSLEASNFLTDNSLEYDFATATRFREGPAYEAVYRDFFA